MSTSIDFVCTIVQKMMDHLDLKKAQKAASRLKRVCDLRLSSESLQRKDPERFGPEAACDRVACLFFSSNDEWREGHDGCLPVMISSDACADAHLSLIEDLLKREPRRSATT
jgi:hypothetical protein